MATRKTTTNHDDGIEGDLELATGAVAGAAAGALAGPVGAIVGAGVGTAAAVLAREALARDGEEPETPVSDLRAEHEALAALASRALAIVEEGDPEEVRALLARIEQRLDAHMEREERALIPRYAEEHPEDAAALRADHATFRRIFEELAIAGDLHLVRLERVKELVDALRTHAKREDVGLYRWASRAEHA